MHTILKFLLEIDDLCILLYGPPGSGKTALLYAILRQYYGFSKNATIPETNILFVNNLKEQGINYFRGEMKTFCQSKSSIPGKKKTIVIDDLDNINEQSQQVLRNYIDKYKQNIHFISVCTNIQKIIESFQSRIHILQLHPPSQANIREIMENIVATECIAITEDAKEYLLEICENSVRVLINYLEKFYIYGDPIDLEMCRKMCSNIQSHLFAEYIECLKRKDIYGGINILFGMYDVGYSVIDILDYFFNYIKTLAPKKSDQQKLVSDQTNPNQKLVSDQTNPNQKLVSDQTNPNLSEDQIYRMIPIICKYITIFNQIHENSIELALFTNDLCKLL
jgi:DNA polymerase III delta prime subunit